LGLYPIGTGADGAVLIRVGTELRSLRHPWSINNVVPANDAPPAVSPDGRALAIVIAGSFDKQGQSHDSNLFIVDTATGQSRIQVGNYETPAWSPDGTRIAAIGDNGLAIIDVATHKEVARAGWPKPDAPPQDLVWSPDGKYVLAGLYGEEGGAGDPQSDYFLLNIAAGIWTPVPDGSTGGLASGRRHSAVSASVRDEGADPWKYPRCLDRATRGFRPGNTQGH
jgi:dipeptidyl aminopeptidase/acylaminoacyl peptidase